MSLIPDMVPSHEKSSEPIECLELGDAFAAHSDSRRDPRGAAESCVHLMNCKKAGQVLRRLAYIELSLDRPVRAEVRLSLPLTSPRVHPPLASVRLVHLTTPLQS